MNLILQYCHFSQNMLQISKMTQNLHACSYSLYPGQRRKAFTRTRGNKETRENGGSGRDCLDKNKL